MMKERERWRESIESIKRMRQWVLDAEDILNGSWAEPHEESENKAKNQFDERHVKFRISEKKSENISKLEQSKRQKLITNEKVGARFDDWRGDLAKKLEDGTLTQKEHQCLEHFLKTLDGLRPYLIQCYDQENFPRTNNETEGCIQKIKARYRRISGRKNWNNYLLKHGRNVGLYDWWESSADRWQQFEMFARNVTKEKWDQNRKKQNTTQHEQLIRYRFRHQHEKYLTVLENLWEDSASLNSDSPSLLLP
jgi:hypothetical protein